jgi:hypothetical protein
MQTENPVILAEDVNRFRRRAEKCRLEAEVMFNERERQEKLRTALAYERMAERAERLSNTPNNGANDVR